MSDAQTESRFVFPRWANYALPGIVLLALGGAFYTPVLVGYGFSPKTTAVGYAPKQPIEYSHALHVGKLGMDCRYCHTTVDQAAFAALPSTQVCMNCHDSVRADSDKLLALRQSWTRGTPIEWVKVHNLPGYAYFNHAAHVNKGVGCVSCHGRVDQMEVVRQVQPLSMAWCLECHREPEKHLRPLDQITQMGWQAPGGDQLRLGKELKVQFGLRDSAYMTSCSTCHR
jgi:menaquinone reductase, multiheme cytochrome c subunit